MLTIPMTTGDDEVLGFLIAQAFHTESQTPRQQRQVLARIQAKMSQKALHLTLQEGVELYSYLLRLTEHPLVIANRILIGATGEFLRRIVRAIALISPSFQAIEFDVAIETTGLELDLIRSCLYEWQDDLPAPGREHIPHLWLVLDTMRDMCLLDADIKGQDYERTMQPVCTLTFSTSVWKIVASLLYTFVQNVPQQAPDRAFFCKTADHCINTINIALIRSHPFFQDEEGVAA